MPFGLKNSPATFMNMMNSVISKILDKFALIFIDDILVYSKNEDHLQKIFQTLREHQLYVKLSKCDFYKMEVQYLGHVISGK